METLAQEVLDDFKFTNMLIHRYADGVEDDEAVLQPPFEANCMNWIVGHIVSRRNSSLECLQRQPVWDEVVMARYRSGSPPILEAGQGKPLGQLIQDLDKTVDGLEHALAGASLDDLQMEVENDRGRKSVVDHLKGFHWHETFHLGQLELLRNFIEAQRNRSAS